MFDKNSIIGLVLILGIMIGFAYLNQPTPQELQTYSNAQDSLKLLEKQDDSLQNVLSINQIKTDSIRTVDTSAKNDAFGIFAPFANGTEEFSTIENENLRITFSNKGGRIYRIQLKKYKNYTQSPLFLAEGQENEMGFSFASNESKVINTKDLYFTPVISENKKSISMFVKLNDAQFIEQKYSFDANTNVLKYKLKLEGMNNVIAQNSGDIDIFWKSHLLPQEKTHDAEERVSTIYYRIDGEEPSYLSEGTEVVEKIKSKMNWVSFKQQYFNQTIIADKGFTYSELETKNDPDKKYVKITSAKLSFVYNHEASESYDMTFYFGPNHYKTLEKFDLQMERIVTMGWGIFRWVNKYVVVNVFAFLNQYITSFGIIILLLTILIKTALFPLVYKSYMSAAKMKVLKPEIDEIKEKHGNDMTKVQQENMKLYRKAGVNPFGGCIPALLQLPILFAMFQFFPSAFELRQQGFLWADDLSTYDSVLALPFSVPIYGSHVSLFALLMTISSLFYALYNVQSTGLTGQMKWISIIMPVAFLLTLNSFAAGLNYYYFLSNLATIAQQLTIKAFVDDKALHTQIQENKKKPIKKSKFQQKLEDMAKKRGVDTSKLGK